MKIAIHSYAFPPSVGGIETVSERLALGLASLGHEVTIITETAGDLINPAYETVRVPSLRKRLAIIKRSDVILSNGASLRCALPALLVRKPFAWIHQGYQTLCIDGLGWWNSKPAPLRPIPSIAFHLRQSGLFYTIARVPQLMMRIAIARYFAHNVVVSECTNRRLNFPRKILIPNPHPLEIFQTARYGAKRTTDFLFVGRLVSEKGCHLILEALALIKSMGKYYSLLIVGNGDEVGKLKALSIEKDLSEQVTFLDGKKGEELAQIMAGCAVGIVPSLWAEPYGGVAVELMAAGLPVITTEDSGPEDKIATVGATVPKGDVVALADAMQRTLEFARANPEQVAIELNQNIAPFSEALLLKQYEKLLIQMLTRSPTQ